MKTKQAPADHSLKLKTVNEGTVLRIRDHDFHVMAAEQHDGLVHLTLQAPDGDHCTFIGTKGTRVRPAPPLDKRRDKQRR
jgi:hypothetical protein